MTPENPLCCFSCAHALNASTENEPTCKKPIMTPAETRRDPILPKNFMSCPRCHEVIADPKWRRRVLVSNQGVACPNCSCPLCVAGVRILPCLLGLVLLATGGGLFSAGYPFLFSALFFIAGCGALVEGVRRIELIEAPAGEAGSVQRS